MQQTIYTLIETKIIKILQFYLILAQNVYGRSCVFARDDSAQH